MKRIVYEHEVGVPLDENIANSLPAEEGYYFSAIFSGDEQLPLSEVKKIVGEQINAVFAICGRESMNVEIARRAWFEGKTCEVIASEMSTVRHPISPEAVKKRLQRFSDLFPNKQYLPGHAVES